MSIVERSSSPRRWTTRISAALVLLPPDLFQRARLLLAGALMLGCTDGATSVENSLPVASAVVIAGQAMVGAQLSGTYVFSDTDGDLEGTSTFRWLRDGSPIAGATTTSYTLVSADEGTSIVFEVTPVALTGVTPGVAVQSAPVGPVAAANSVPTASEVQITGTAEVGQALTGSYAYEDVDGDLEGTSTFRWLRDGSPIAGATTTSYTLVSADEGTSIVFEVTPVALTGATAGLAVQSAPVGPVQPASTQSFMLEARVGASSDDAEEATDGSIDLTSSDLELINENTDQTVGIRFNGLGIPHGATITDARIQFQADETDSGPATLTIRAQVSDNAPTFTTATGNVSSRSRTTSSVSWSPPSWSTVGAAGADQQTPNIAAVIQEIVSRPGWSSGNSLVILITGSGTRTAESFNGDASGAPLLGVDFSGGSASNRVPTASALQIAGVAEVGQALTGSYTYEDVDGDLEGASTLRWLRDGSPIAGATTTSYTLVSADEGRSIVFEVTPVALTGATPGVAVQSAPVGPVAPQDGPFAVLVGAGDIARCGSDGDEQTASLLDAIPGTVYTTGDNAYPDGSAEDYADCYEPSWGRHKARTRPSPGNHDYHATDAEPYFDYFGDAAGIRGTGYYSYDVGEWHVISLDSEIDMDAGSPQEQWLRADLAANPTACTLAYWHKPRFSSGERHGTSSRPKPLWEALYEYGADLVLNGHEHLYERFAPQTPDGALDLERGIRQFTIGTGGAGLYDFTTPLPNSEARYNESWGVLKLSLYADRYVWQFIPVAGSTYTDTGRASCR